MPLVPSAELLEMARRLDGDYRARIAELHGGFSVWANRTQVTAEISLESRLGRRWAKSIRYARRLVPFGRPLRTRSLDEVESELRALLDDWIKRATRGR